MTTRIGSVTDIKGDFAQRVHCGRCRVPLNQTEKIFTVNINKKLIDRKAQSFLCKACADTNQEPTFAHRIEEIDGIKTVLEARTVDLPDNVERSVSKARSKTRSKARNTARSTRTTKPTAEETDKAAAGAAKATSTDAGAEKKG